MSLFLIFSCSEDKGILEESLAQNISLEINNSLDSVMSREDSLLVNSIENYLTQFDDNNYDHRDSWFYSDSMSVYPYFELYKNVLESNRIQVLALIEQGGYKVVKLGFFNGTNIESILNIPAIPSKQMGFIFLNYYDTYIRVNPERYGNIRYFNHSTYQLNQEDINEMIRFSKKLSAFFDIPELEFDCYVFNNSKELFASLGYDYGSNMYDAYQENSFCRPADWSLFLGTSTAYHPHELAHLYVHSFVGNGNPNVANPNKYLDEGFATYFGGAQGGFPLESSTQMALDDFETREICFENKDQLGFLIEGIVNFKNVFYGNFIKYLIDFHGPESALYALKTYKTDDELDQLIASHMLPDESFNDFVLRIIMSNNFDNE